MLDWFVIYICSTCKSMYANALIGIEFQDIRHTITVIKISMLIRENEINCSRYFYIMESSLENFCKNLQFLFSIIFSYIRYLVYIQTITNIFCLYILFFRFATFHTMKKFMKKAMKIAWELWMWMNIEVSVFELDSISRYNTFSSINFSNIHKHNPPTGISLVVIIA